MDFFQIIEHSKRSGVREIVPDFKVCKSNDFMVRGKSFYAIWDEDRRIWSEDEYDVVRLVDEELFKKKAEIEELSGDRVKVKTMKDFNSNVWKEFKKYISSMSNTSKQLNTTLTFANTDVKKKDYSSKKLPYSLSPGPTASYDELMSILYSPEERQKIEWAIGAVVAGEAKYIQKFLVLYGPGGTGKSTVLNIIEQLFEGYCTFFEAKALASANNQFSTEPFRSDPLVAIQHDGDLSKIDDNTKLNSIISHENMLINEKYKGAYSSRINCFLFMGTNKPVKITDSKSGIIRRLIDVHPTGNKVPVRRYHELTNAITFELGAIASRCLDVFLGLGKDYYMGYIPFQMLQETDIFFNFIEENYSIFAENDGISLAQAYTMYKNYCEESAVQYLLPKHRFREELNDYFKTFSQVTRVDGKQVRSWYSGFRKDKFKTHSPEESPISLVLDKTASIFDEELANAVAQYATEKGTPAKKWANVTTILSDLDTSKEHYVQLPGNHIVIDFDLKTNGEKDSFRNLEAASQFPPTYAEFSRGGSGVHLHYIYDGDASLLAPLYAEDIEIKVSSGNSALRRKLSKCNGLPIAHIAGGLPLKGEKMVDFGAIANEKAIRTMIHKNLRKEIHPGTKPSVDFIFKILDDAYKQGVKYDVSDLRPAVLAFANNSTNQSAYCVELVSRMQFKSEENSASVGSYSNDELVFFDVEVFPNLFVVVWKTETSDPVIMINPKSHDIEQLMNRKLVGFNNRRYDNHILYGSYIGYDNARIYELSQRIINGSANALFGEAYNLSYADIYDFSNVKQSLKKFEIDLGMHHQELGFKWDEPVPEKDWELVASYCVNDVLATEATFKARRADFVARQILADLSGLSVNDTTQMHAARIILEGDKHAKEQFVYTDLAQTFPGYKFEGGKSSYRGEDPKEGGYVFAIPGIYGNAALLDIESMHPTSACIMDIFGVYTQNYRDILDARLAIKHRDLEKAKTLLKGVLAPYLEHDEDADSLAYALKIIINSVYGYTSATFDSKFKDPRNKDNIVAKRGALFMIDLKHAVQEQGFTVIHIKTDSIKIADATPEIIQFVMDFGKKYGYKFEHEMTFDRIYLANDAAYIARVGWDAKHKAEGKWTATGMPFINPYIFKTLFSHEPLTFDDLCETKSVTTALYLDMNEGLMEGDHAYQFVGRIGQFCPVLPGSGGGLLLREKEGKYYSVGGSKGFRWIESEKLRGLGLEEISSIVDSTYHSKTIEDILKNINSFADVEWFIDPKLYDKHDNGILPF